VVVAVVLGGAGNCPPAAVAGALDLALAVEVLEALVHPGLGTADRMGQFGDLGVLRPSTVLVTTVHPLQVVDEPLPETVHDFRVDLIVTPEGVIWCGEPRRPPGILWEHLDQDKIAEVPVLAALAAQR
jgi:5-formyltetrahydrofolate cyclo-ligase